MTDTLQLRARVDAPLDTVRRALTDAAALRTWLAEHAEVDLPNRYEFWGRYTPDGAEPRQRVLHSDERTIRLEWTIEGQATTTEITLAPESEAATVISVSQSHVPDWTEVVREQGLAALSTFWSLSIANLIAYLEGREPTPKCDFVSGEMRAHVDIAATPEAVYESMMDPESYARWFGVTVGIEPWVGGRWQMGGFDSPAGLAKIVELEPNRKVTLDHGDDLVVTWELDGSAGKTRLTFVHSGFDEPPYAGWMGWLSGVAELRRYHEIPGWRPMWLDVELPGLPEGMLTSG